MAIIPADLFYSKPEFERAHERLNTPALLSERDLVVLKTFGSESLGARAEEARMRALNRPLPPSAAPARPITQKRLMKALDAYTKGLMPVLRKQSDQLRTDVTKQVDQLRADIEATFKQEFIEQSQLRVKVYEAVLERSRSKEHVEALERRLTDLVARAAAPAPAPDPRVATLEQRVLELEELVRLAIAHVER